MPPLFTRAGAWTGGSYELLLEYEPLEVEALRSAVEHLWTHPSLDGCYRNLATEPGDQSRINLAEADPARLLCGIATLPNGDRAPSSSIVVADEEATWVYFGVPMGSLGYSYPVGAYPFADGLPLDWRNPLDKWLRGVAEFVFAAHPFRLGFIGWIDPLDTTAADIAEVGIPRERWRGYLVPDGSNLDWHPPTEGAPFTVP